MCVVSEEHDNNNENDNNSSSLIRLDSIRNCFSSAATHVYNKMVRVKVKLWF